jgi:hypothetical protein
MGCFFSVHSLAQSCDPSLTSSIRAIEKLVDLLPGDGVHAQDVQRDEENICWMHGELGLIREACSRGEDVEAAWRLEQVQIRIAIIGNPGPARQFRQVSGRKTNIGATIARSQVLPTS